MADTNYSFQKAEDAFEHLKDTINGYSNVELYATSSSTLEKEIKKLYELIKQYNSTIEDPEMQCLPSNPYYYHEIKGCLGVDCVEITGGTYEKNADKISLFTGWNYNVLQDPSMRKTPCTRAMASLALMGSMMFG